MKERIEPIKCLSWTSFRIHDHKQCSTLRSSHSHSLLSTLFLRTFRLYSVTYDSSGDEILLCVDQCVDPSCRCLGDVFFVTKTSRVAFLCSSLSNRRLKKERREWVPPIERYEDPRQGPGSDVEDPCGQHEERIRTPLTLRSLRPRFTLGASAVLVPVLSTPPPHRPQGL